MTLHYTLLYKLSSQVRINGVLLYANSLRIYTIYIYKRVHVRSPCLTYLTREKYKNIDLPCCAHDANFYTVSSESQCQFGARLIRSRYKNSIESNYPVFVDHALRRYSVQRIKFGVNRRSQGMNLQSVNYSRMPASLVILSHSHCSYPLHGLALLRTGSMVLTGEKKRRKMENKEREKERERIPNK